MNCTLLFTIAVVGPVAAPHQLSRALKLPVELKTAPPKRAVFPLKQVFWMRFALALLVL